MSFSETIFLFVLALVVFGPKKLPEIARQVGKVLAELRRASNEFKSQIQTEIDHLEVEKKQTVLPPSGPPPGAVATMSLNPATVEATPHQTQATLAAPADMTPPDRKSGVEASNLPSAVIQATEIKTEHNPIPASDQAGPASPAASDPVPLAPQDSHA